MWKRVSGLAMFVLGGLWQPVFRYLSEFGRSILYDRILAVLGEDLIQWGPTAGLAAAGVYLFWRSGSGEWPRSRFILIHDAARLAYEAAERADVLDVFAGPETPPEISLAHFKHVF